MGTRSGDIDPGLVGYLAERTGQSAAALTQALNTRISRPGPAVALVVPTDEELMIARDTPRLVATRPASPSSPRR